MARGTEIAVRGSSIFASQTAEGPVRRAVGYTSVRAAIIAMARDHSGLKIQLGLIGHDAIDLVLRVVGVCRARVAEVDVRLRATSIGRVRHRSLTLGAPVHGVAPLSVVDLPLDGRGAQSSVVLK